MRLLRIGSKGSDVSEVQAKLGIKADGLFGPKTEMAVKIYQVQNDLKDDGIVGPLTYRALGINLPEKPPRPVPPRLTLPEIFAKFEEGTAEFYEACYRILEFDPGTETRIKAAADRVTGSMWPEYVELERLRGIPAVMTGLIHAMECNNHPLGTLHNGQKIIGQRRKTTIVPIGRGPFRTWIEGALDAVDTQAIWRVPEWSLGWMLRQCEKFNGWGYVTGAGRQELSPYIWACTNINDGYGKYTSDGRFDANAPSNGQVGIASIVKYLELAGRVDVKFSTLL